MTHRITTDNVERPAPVTIRVNGTAVQAYEGESIATALLAAGVLRMSRDAAGSVRGPFCNMGVCCDCIVLLDDERRPDRGAIRVKSCLTVVRPGLSVTVPACEESSS